jgi:hypothetical protein
MFVVIHKIIRLLVYLYYLMHLETCVLMKAYMFLNEKLKKKRFSFSLLDTGKEVGKNLSICYYKNSGLNYKTKKIIKCN